MGEIPGDDPSKIYLMTAHFDTIADDTKDPVLAPGALDNATGVSVLLEMARALSGYQLQHPVHFAFFNAEEYALQGAHAFARNASTIESRPYAGAYNVDSVGASLPQNQLYVNANQAVALSLEPARRHQRSLGTGRGGLALDERQDQSRRVRAEQLRHSGGHGGFGALSAIR